MRKTLLSYFLSFFFFLLLSVKAQGQEAAGQYHLGAWIRSDTSVKEIKLIFTGHEFAEGYPVIKAALDSLGVKASFFFTGDFYRNPEFASLIQELKAEGHYLGPHSDRHLLYCDWGQRDSLLVSRDSFMADLEGNYAAMATYGISKQEAPCFLPPYEWYNDSIAAWTREAGCTLVNLTPGTQANQDWSYPAPDVRYFSTDSLFKKIWKYETQEAHRLKGFHLLLHIGVDPRRPDPFYLRLEELLRALRGRGYQFKTFLHR